MSLWDGLWVRWEAFGPGWLRGRSQCLDIRSIVRNMSHANTAERKHAFCVMVGNQDVLMDL